MHKRNCPLDCNYSFTYRSGTAQIQSVKKIFFPAVTNMLHLLTWIGEISCLISCPDKLLCSDLQQEKQLQLARVENLT